MSYKPTFTICFLLVLTFFLANPNPISAHVLKTDGQVGAVLHIDPDDDPIVGQEAHFYFDFKSQGTNFNVNNCSCVAEILVKDNVIYSQPLTSLDQDLTSGHFSFTFPKKGIYQVTVTGSQEIAGSTKNFELTYDLRVDRESKSNSDEGNFFEQYSIYVVFGIIIVVLLLTFLLSKKR